MKRVPVRYLLFFSSGALELLGNEIVPNTPPAAASAQYRKGLAISLFYKVDTSIFVQICPSYIPKFSTYDVMVYQFFCSSPLPPHTHTFPPTHPPTMCSSPFVFTCMLAVLFGCHIWACLCSRAVCCCAPCEACLSGFPVFQLKSLRVPHH